MSDKPKLVLDECFTPSSSSVHSNEENKITIKENPIVRTISISKNDIEEYIIELLIL